MIQGLFTNVVVSSIPKSRIISYHNDHSGTPLKMTDENGQVVWSADYMPFGDASVTTADMGNSFRFPGQYYDAETGLHYNYLRYYDPQTGRYLTPDPIGLDGGINLFSYVENNPVNTTDPKGLHGPILFGRTPYFYRIAILRKFFRIPLRGGIPNESPVEPTFRPTRPPTPQDLGVPPDDLWWQQDPFPPRPKPFNPNRPVTPITPNSDPCEQEDNFKSWPPTWIPSEWIT
jgi:RHS repeat-associated protein